MLRYQELEVVYYDIALKCLAYGSLQLVQKSGKHSNKGDFNGKS